MTQDHDILRALDAELAEIERLVSDLDHAHAHPGVHDGARDLDRAITRAVSLDSDRTRNLGRVRDFTHDLDRGLDHVRDLTQNVGLAHDLDFDPARARDLARDLDFDSAHDLAHDLGSDGNFDNDRAIAIAVAIARDLDRNVAHNKVDLLAATVREVRHGVQAELTRSNVVTAVPGANAVVSPARSALRVLHHTLWVLPAVDRVRYQEELEAELTELATAGATRQAQLAYVLGLAVRMWSLRHALRAAVPSRERLR